STITARNAPTALWRVTASSATTPGRSATLCIGSTTSAIHLRRRAWDSSRGTRWSSTSSTRIIAAEPPTSSTAETTSSASRWPPRARSSSRSSRGVTAASTESPAALAVAAQALRQENRDRRHRDDEEGGDIGHRPVARPAQLVEDPDRQGRLLTGGEGGDDHLVERQ